MIYASIVLFALAAIFGLAILVKWLTNKSASRTVVYLHGVAAVAALALLIVYAIQHPGNFPKVSLLLFAIAAVAGIYMFLRDLNQKTSPLPIAFIHGLVAVSAFVVLLLFALS